MLFCSVKMQLIFKMLLNSREHFCHMSSYSKEARHTICSWRGRPEKGLASEKASHSLKRKDALV